MLTEQIVKRLERAGDVSPGALNLAADIVELCRQVAVAETGFMRAPRDREIVDGTLFLAVERLRSKSWPKVPGS